MVDEFGAVYEHERDGLLRLAGVLTGDAGLAEDAVAETFARVFSRWRRGGIDDPGAYLRRALVNLLATSWRRRSRAPLPPLATPVGGADDGIAERDAVWQALLTLPVRQRAVIVLRHLEGRSEADTADLLGIPLGSVKSANARGLERLRTLLAEEQPDHA